jgi:hypothetical protein
MIEPHSAAAKTLRAPKAKNREPCGTHGAPDAGHRNNEFDDTLFRPTRPIDAESRRPRFGQRTPPLRVPGIA